MDIRQLVAGTSVCFPVDVPGALFSAGDAHFAQGDGETCGTAIETSSSFTARFELDKGEATRRRLGNPTFTTPALPERTIPATKDSFCTTALSATDGVVFPLDASVAARNALRAMVDALCVDRDYTREQAYLIASVAVHSKPTDPGHFDDYYTRVHIPLTKKIRGVVDVHYGHVDSDPNDPDGPYVICNVIFPDRATYEAAATSPEAAVALTDVPNFSTGGVKLHTVDFDNYHLGAE